jgi:uncharacterized membrane protein YiaA
MGFFFVWIVFAVLVGVYAANKGRSGPGFFFLSLILSPLIGFIIAAVVSPDRVHTAEKAGLRRCPQCAEFIQPEAVICRFCGYKFPREVGGIVIEE